MRSMFVCDSDTPTVLPLVEATISPSTCPPQSRGRSTPVSPEDRVIEAVGRRNVQACAARSLASTGGWYTCRCPDSTAALIDRSWAAECAASPAAAPQPNPMKSPTWPTKSTWVSDRSDWGTGRSRVGQYPPRTAGRFLGLALGFDFFFGGALRVLTATPPSVGVGLLRQPDPVERGHGVVRRRAELREDEAHLHVVREVRAVGRRDR